VNGRDARLLDILGQDRQIRVPIWQRPYAWTTKECRKLIADVRAVGRATGNAEHFLGSIVTVDAGAVPLGSLQTHNIVDGQQRLLTVSLLLAAIANREHADSSERDLREPYLLNNRRSGSDRYRFRPGDSDFEAFRNVVDGLEVSAVGPISDNYKYFKRELADPVTREEIKVGLTRVKVITTLLEPPGDNVHRTFESINSSGKPLSQFDLIRNYVLMDIDPEEQSRVYTESWRPLEKLFGNFVANKNGSVDAFVREYLGLKTGRKPNIGQIYETYVAFGNASGLSKAELAADLMTWGRRYTSVAFGQPVASDVGGIVRTALYDLRTANGDQFSGLAMMVLQQLDLDSLNAEHSVRILALFESFIVRRYLCGVPTNARNKVIARILNEAFNRARIDENLVANQLLAANSIYAQRTPDDAEVLRSLREHKIYGANGGSLYGLLLKLGNYGQRETVTSATFSIEHVMPQTATSDWKADIGNDYDQVHAQYVDALPNLTLVAANAQLGQKRFVEKRDEPEVGFRASAFSLNRWIARQDTWNRAVLEARATELARIVSTVWPFPVATTAGPSVRDQFVDSIASADRTRAQELLEVFDASDTVTVAYDGAARVSVGALEIFTLNADGILLVQNDNSVELAGAESSQAALAELLSLAREVNPSTEAATISIVLASLSRDQADRLIAFLEQFMSSLPDIEASENA
jgi:hypothetical protein